MKVIKNVLLEIVTLIFLNWKAVRGQVEGREKTYAR